MPCSPRLTRRSLLLAAAITGTAAACSSAGGTGASEGGDAVTPTTGSDRTDVSSLWDASTLHTIEATLDEEELAAMIETYLDSEEKEWITGQVTIDGTAFEEVGFKLKGNSSLQGISTDDDPATLPWRIRLDKYVDDQSFEGAADLVVRSNTTATSLNEAVALDLLAEAGLASQLSVATAFTVNGGDPQLRLALEHMDDAWMASVFSADGTLYKSDADGDWSYVDEDPASYEEAFDVEAGEEDYTPLIAFLEFLDSSSDEDFAAQLEQYLEVEAFARYLALEDMMSNFDDIDGPGNNSYLYYGPDAGTMTVVAWDHNLAFGASNGGGGQMPGGGELPADGEMPAMPSDAGGAMPGGGQMPTDGEMPGDGPMPTDGEMPSDAGGAMPSDAGGASDGGGGQGGPGGGGMQGNNPLASRFTENTEFAAMVEKQTTTLQEELVDSGRAQEILDARAAVLTEQASELVSAEDVTTDAEQITAVLNGTAETTGRGSEASDAGGDAASDGGS